MKTKHYLLSILYRYKSCTWSVPNANEATCGDPPALGGGEAREGWRKVVVVGS